VRIAKPLLLTTTPIGMAFGLLEAWRFRPVLALLMLTLFAVLGLATFLTIRRIRRDERES
jgi:hypothetical protein